MDKENYGVYANQQVLIPRFEDSFWGKNEDLEIDSRYF